MTDHRPLLRRPGCFVPLAVFVSGFVSVIALVGSVLFYGLPTDYSHEIFVSLPSSTGEWTAVVSVDVVDGPPLLSSVTAGVILTSTIYPTWSIYILGFDWRGDKDDLPRIAWSAPNVLRVTVPNLSDPYILTRHAGGVDVDIHFEPDDPAARAAARAEWLKQMGRPPE
jgi:hypothetical protein